ncbi:hypothetical protein RJ55_07141 [Drechmeria coniospora]|nr:hypothetical protein RJ55_07141 [Drechmeria coniospora]
MARHASGLLGGIVAFEGRPETVSTQLRLLPTSPQLLILPSVQCYLPVDYPDRDFDAREHVRQVQDAFTARNEAARAFLQGSTPTNKRLVFMNGGAPSAQALCIKAIMKYETFGAKAEAAAIFDHLVRDGLAGLRRGPGHSIGRNSAGPVSNERPRSGDFDDPITRAMRAADALDRQTANLQPAGDFDILACTRQRSSSLPLYGYSDEFGDAAPFLVFGARRESQCEDAVSPSAASPPIMGLDESPWQKSTRLPSAASDSPPCSPTCVGVAYSPEPVPACDEVDDLSPMSDVFSIHTIDNVVYGEASLLDMRPSVRPRSLARVKSLDRLFPASPKFRDLCTPSASWLGESEARKSRRPQSLMLVTDARDASRSRLSSIEQPRTVMINSRLSLANNAMPSRETESAAEHRPTYVDRGTDANEHSTQKPPFQPVFACTEDLVVYLKEGTPDGVLESAINSIKDGRYPLISPSPPASVSEAWHKPSGTPNSRATRRGMCSNAASEGDAAALTPSPNDGDDDSFAYAEPRSQTRRPSHVALKVTIVRSPTPLRTPPSSVVTTESEQLVHEFAIAPDQTAVAVQNSLRSILGNYFPPDTDGYHQFHFSLLPELDALWKPIFRTTGRGNLQKVVHGDMSQILAIGSQVGVKKEYSDAITGQLEKLGSKSSHLGRADRLDFRYLLANAMQAFTAQPLANQTSDNPFTNSYLLATLIVPHLETYLVLHSEVRYLLLQYPPEHLATMLALQKLVGVDLMKVAQIVDSGSKDHAPFTHIRGASIGSKPESSPNTRSSPSPRSPPDVSVSEANFLLTSAASDKDIANFVSTVWNFPADISDSEECSGPNTPERPPRPTPSTFPRPTARKVREGSCSSVSTFEREVSVSPKTLALTSPTARPDSASDTVVTFTSSEGDASRMDNAASYEDTEAEEVVAFDHIDDSDCDIDERRLMPMFLRKRISHGPNSRKALKFLGLA